MLFRLILGYFASSPAQIWQLGWMGPSCRVVAGCEAAEELAEGGRWPTRQQLIVGCCLNRSAGCSQLCGRGWERDAGSAARPEE